MNSLDTYIKSIKGFGRITREREKKLSGIIRRSRNLQNVEKAKEELVQANLLLVVNRALKLKSKYMSHSLGAMDLIAEGNIGLMKAASLYRSDHKSKAAFGTFAIPCIDSSIIRAIQMDRIIHIPLYYLKYRSDLSKLKQIYGNKLTDEIVQRELDISDEMMGILKNDTNRNTLSLEGVFQNDDGCSHWNDVLEDTNVILPSVSAENVSLFEHLIKYVDQLNYREKFVIEARHLRDKQLSFDEIASFLKISRERVRQIDVAALRKLRKFIATDWQDQHGDSDIPNVYTRKEICEINRKREEEINKVFKHLLNGI